MSQSLYHTCQRYRTLQTHRIRALPILILMPHSACNCRCVMCDIWKGNRDLKQLQEEDIMGLLHSLKKWGTKQVLLSGGEALLHPRFFRFCELLKRHHVHVSLLSTGLALARNRKELVKWVDDIIVSLDGDEALHDTIRNISGAFASLKEGIGQLRMLQPSYPVTGRTVIHRLNFRSWPAIVDSARAIGLNRISFLPADVSSTAFNREQPWGVERQQEVALHAEELPELEEVIGQLLHTHRRDFAEDFIAESPAKLKAIYQYYAAHCGLCDFPAKKCNAPWVSAVVEADGSVKPCFFHGSIGNIHSDPLDTILNHPKAIEFRKELDMAQNEICRRCVCSLHLPFHQNPVQN
jgi:Fe-coproporphyrin III synthase